MKKLKLLIVLIITLAAGYILRAYTHPTAVGGIPNALTSDPDTVYTIESIPLIYEPGANPPKPTVGQDLIIVSYTTPFSVYQREALPRKHMIPLSSAHHLFNDILCSKSAKFKIKGGQLAGTSTIGPAY